MSGKRKGVSLTDVIAVILTVMVVAASVGLISNTSVIDKFEGMFSNLDLFDQTDQAESDPADN